MIGQKLGYFQSILRDLSGDADVLLFLLDGDRLRIGSFATVGRIEKALARQVDFDGGGLVDVLLGEQLQIFVVQIGGSVDLAGESAAMTDEGTEENSILNNQLLINWLGESIRIFIAKLLGPTIPSFPSH